MASISTPALTFEQFMELTKDRRPWPELVDGEIVERPVPNETHSYIQARAAQFVLNAGLIAVSENHSRIGANVRIPDVAIRAALTGQDYPDVPPLVAVEILSPANRMNDMMRKFRDYAAWGVPHIWLIDPDLPQLYTYNNGSLDQVDALELPEHKLRLTLADLLPPKSPSLAQS